MDTPKTILTKIKTIMSMIKFYKVNEPYGFFSNFSAHPIFIDNERWNTVEHYFQASKFDDKQIKKKIQSFESPMKAAAEGRNKKNTLVENWELIKDTVMYKALKCKFIQHPKLMQELLSTRACILIEHTTNDDYWGDGGDGQGQNQLGVLLMQLREELFKEVEDVLMVFPPWIAFPTIDQYDLFWRMGFGEEYLTQWVQYYSATNQIKYRTKYPEPSDWEGFYD